MQLQHYLTSQRKFLFITLVLNIVPHNVAEESLRAVNISKISGYIIVKTNFYKTEKVRLE
jgi:hypothetical protein